MRKWIIGDFKTGNISSAEVLPVVRDSDKVDLDINAGDSANLRVSLRDLPSAWKTYLAPLKKFVAYIDTEATWDKQVLFAGFISKAEAAPQETANIQIAGLREYLSYLTISSVYDGSSTNPDAGIDFTGATWEDVYNRVVTTAFSTSGIPSGSPVPPQVLGTVQGSSTTGISYQVKNVDFWSYSDALNEIRDERSAGEEYRFIPRWSDSSMTRLVWDSKFGTAAQPHINENISVDIVLGDNAWKPITWRESLSIEQMASRMVANSKTGDTVDFYTKTRTENSEILIDQTFNPGVELTSAEMTDQVVSRLNYASSPARTASFERAYDTMDELRAIQADLGKMANFTGTGVTANFGLSMRIVGVTFTASENKVTITLMQKAARYPKLPKRGSLVPPSPSQNSPIVPRTPPNQPIPGGGGTPVLPPPPFEIPTFGEDSPLTIEGGKVIRRAGSGTSSAWLYLTPKLSTMRKYGKFLYALSTKGSFRSSNQMANTASAGLAPSVSDLFVYCYDLDTNPDLTTNYTAQEPYTSLIGQDSATSDAAIVASTISANVFTTNDSEMIIAGQQNYNPALSSSSTSFVRNFFSHQYGAFSAVDYDLIIGENDVFVRVFYSITNCAWNFVAPANASEPSSDIPDAKWKIKEIVYRGTRDPLTGAIGTLAPMASSPFEYVDKGIDRIWWAPGSIYVYDNKFYSFGGYGMTKSLILDNFKVTSGTFPHWATTYYQQTLFTANLDGSGKVFTENFLDFSDEGPTSKNLSHMRITDMVRPNRLSSRVNDNQVVVGYSNGLTNRREYFYATLPNLKFAKVMDTNAGPQSNLVFGEEIMRNTDAGVAPEIVGDNILLFEASGVRATGMHGSQVSNSSFTNRKINLSRCKIGFEDTVFSSYSLPDAVGISPPYRWAPLSDDLLNAAHGFGAFFGVKGNVPDHGGGTTQTVHSNQWKWGLASLTLGESVNQELNAHFIGSVGQRGYAVETSPFKSYNTKGISTPYNPAAADGSPRNYFYGLASDFYYFIHAGKLYFFSERSVVRPHRAATSYSSQPGCILQRYSVNSSGW